jgi:hypothetical protein
LRKSPKYSANVYISVNTPQVFSSNYHHPIFNMSAVVEKVTDAVKDVSATLSNTSISDKPAETAATATGGDKASNAAHNEAVLASAAEGRRLYIGNLAYATTEGELTSFFNGYLM